MTNDGRRTPHAYQCTVGSEAVNMASRDPTIEDDPIAEIPSLRGYRYIDTENVEDQTTALRYVDTEDVLVQCSDLMQPYHIAAQACSVHMAEVLQLLTSERRDSPVYDQAWRNAERLLQDNDSVLVQGSPPECTVAVLAFTTQQELHQDFTLKCKEAHTWEALPYKSLYCLLTRCIHTVNNRPDLHQHVYRGASFHYDKHQFKSGATIYLKHFLPCTTDPEVARKGGGTVIQFPKYVAAAIGVQDFVCREEVVVFPWSTFVVKKVEDDMLVLQNTGPFANNVPFSGDLAMLGVSFLKK